MAQALTDAVRIPRPMIRQGWLKHGPRRNANARGEEPFVAVPWDEALDIVANELRRVKEAHGNAAIFAGSYGWASAGRFHHAPSQLRRFMNLFGGHAYSVNAYSTAAAEVIVPHVLGDFWSMTEQMTTWDIIAANTKLMVMFGGASLKNGQVHPGGFGRHVVRESLAACRRRPACASRRSARCATMHLIFWMRSGSRRDRPPTRPSSWPSPIACSRPGMPTRHSWPAIAWAGRSFAPTCWARKTAS